MASLWYLALKMAPDDFAFWYSYAYIILIISWTSTTNRIMWKQQYVTPKASSQKTLWLPPCSLGALALGQATKVSQEYSSCPMENSCGAELRPAAKRRCEFAIYVNEHLGNRSSRSINPSDYCSSGCHLYHNLTRGLKPEPPAKSLSDFWPVGTLWNNVYFFKKCFDLKFY